MKFQFFMLPTAFLLLRFFVPFRPFCQSERKKKYANRHCIGTLIFILFFFHSLCAVLRNLENGKWENENAWVTVDINQIRDDWWKTINSLLHFKYSFRSTIFFFRFYISSIFYFLCPLKRWKMSSWMKDSAKFLFSSFRIFCSLECKSSINVSSIHNV